MTSLNLADIRSNEALISAMKSGTKVEFLFFYGHFVPKSGRPAESCYSQWYPTGFELDGVSYPTAEHYMMTQKAKLFDAPEVIERILQVSSPREAKKIGGTIPNFNKETWDEKCFDIVVAGNFAKFSQNKDLTKFLIYSKEKVLAEANPRDKVLGIGLSLKNEKKESPESWLGKNLLGYALMEVRGQAER